jgi:hypothetical protein
VPGSTVLPYIHTIVPSEWPSATVNDERLVPAKRLNWRSQSVHHPSTVATSIYSQLPTVSGGRLFHPDPEDVPCRAESVVHNSRPTHVGKLSGVGIVGCIHALHGWDSLWEGWITCCLRRFLLTEQLHSVNQEQRRPFHPTARE